MNKKTRIICAIVFIIAIGILAFFLTKNISNNNNDTASNGDDNSNYEANRTSANLENNQNEENKISDNLETNQDEEKEQPAPPQVIEEQIATFSTKIYSNDPARQNNINITCSTLTGTTVKNGDTFSFCNTVGQATTSKGYQKADIFDNKGQKKKGLGGGNCQISSTLYNAVLAVPELTVTERHEHSNYVPYIQKGKDAAVAYGSYDFKFVNHTGNDIKIYAEASNENVTTNLVVLKTV